MDNYDDEVYKKAIDKWGINLQIIMMIEEMSELTKVLTKWLRTQSHLLDINIAEEIADVEIMLKQMKYFWVNQNLVDKIKQEKIEKLNIVIENSKGENKEVEPWNRK